MQIIPMGIQLTQLGLTISPTTSLACFQDGFPAKTSAHKLTPPASTKSATANTAPLFAYLILPFYSHLFLNQTAIFKTVRYENSKLN